MQCRVSLLVAALTIHNVEQSLTPAASGRDTYSNASMYPESIISSTYFDDERNLMNSVGGVDFECSVEFMYWPVHRSKRNAYPKSANTIPPNLIYFGSTSGKLESKMALHGVGFLTNWICPWCRFYTQCCICVLGAYNTGTFTRSNRERTIPKSVNKLSTF